MPMSLVGLRGVSEVGTINNQRVLGAYLASCMTFDLVLGKKKGGRGAKTDQENVWLCQKVLPGGEKGTNCSAVFHWGVVCYQTFYGMDRPVYGLYSTVTRVTGVRFAWQTCTSYIFDLVWGCDAPGGFVWSCVHQERRGTRRVLFFRWGL